MSSQVKHRSRHEDSIAVGTPVVRVDGTTLGRVERLGPTSLEVASPDHERYRLNIREVRRIGSKAICVPLDAGALANHRRDSVSPGDAGTGHADASQGAPVAREMKNRRSPAAYRVPGALTLAGGGAAALAAIALNALARRNRHRANSKAPRGLARRLGRLPRRARLVLER